MRKENWPEILAAELEAARGRPFQWGTHDCCAFAAHVVEAMTGVDFMDAFPGYDSADRANVLIEAHGGVGGIATICLGDPIAPLSAQRGDVCLVELSPSTQHAAPSTGVYALGICDGARIYCAGLTGLNTRPLRDALKAWRV